MATGLAPPVRHVLYTWQEEIPSPRVPEGTLMGEFQGEGDSSEL